MKKGAIFCFIVVLIFLVPSILYALEISYQNNPGILLNTLLETGGSGNNPIFTGDTRAIGTYTNLTGLWGIGPGIVLSSGDIKDYADGPNTSESFSTSFGTSGHSGLTNLSGYPTYDAISFGFDFTASQNKISFDFVFGSDEYAEYVGSSYNDVLGVWLTDSSGKKTQLCFDNNNNPITINTAWMTDSMGTELDGSTGWLRTTATAVSGQNYNIEFALADASDHIYDSTVFISNFVGAEGLKSQPNYYGLFVGVQDGNFHGDLDANNLYNTLSTNLNNFKEGTVLTANMEEGGLSDTQVKEAIEALKNKMNPGDTFIFYSTSHGGSDLIGPETTVTFGDEYLSIGGGILSGWDLLTDDELTSYLSDFNDINKWIMIDACHSGGFWGNNNSFDQGDLEKLDNISFFAASEEDKNAYFTPNNGISYFGLALVDAFSLDDNGFLKADINKDYSISFDELTYWVQNYATQAHMDGTVVAEKDLGDLIVFSSDMWTPISKKSDDFIANVYTSPDPNPITNPVPEPSTMFLFASGLTVFTALRKKLKKK